jgi:hypothetical protein
MPNIWITNPPSDSTVGRPFTANGTYADSETPTIAVVLKNSQGHIVASDSTVGDSGNWSVQLDPGQALTGASVTAAIDGTTATDTHNNITVT